MFLGGLWHGASWNFVIWGIMHGAYLAIHKMIVKKIPRLGNHSFFKTKIGIVFSIFVTQYFIFLAWIAFRVQNFDYMIYSMEKFIFLDFQTKIVSEIIISHKFSVVIIILFIILHIISFKKRNLPEKISNYKSKYWIIFLVIIITLILFFNSGNEEDFIYFKF